MPNLMKKLTAAAVALPIMTASSFAANIQFDNECELSLNNDLTITPKHVLIIENDETVVDIYNDQMLFIRGDAVALTTEQQALLKRYSLSLRQAVPQVAEIAIEAVDVAFESINTALGDFSNTESYRPKFDVIKQKLSSKYQSGEANYSFKKGTFSSEIDDKEIENMVEDMMEDIVPDLVGSLLANIGHAIASGDSELSELDSLDERIEAEIQGRVTELENKANLFCENVKSIDALETTLVDSNEKLLKLDLLNVKITKS